MEEFMLTSIICHHLVFGHHVDRFSTFSCECRHDGSLRRSLVCVKEVLSKLEYIVISIFAVELIFLSVELITLHFLEFLLDTMLSSLFPLERMPSGRRRS